MNIITELIKKVKATPERIRTPIFSVTNEETGKVTYMIDAEIRGMIIGKLTFEYGYMEHFGWTKEEREFLRNNKIIYITNIEIDKEHQSKGYARQLYKRFIQNYKAEFQGTKIKRVFHNPYTRAIWDKAKKETNFNDQGLYTFE
ncbi:GNAT family N-acetyltransferase [Aneurinibacillus tyrosinisolvens]|uniref:GNAT family N-acetyltransferase n=1 Tax=Aneurinibacillus tyrosinisolvens TaxID=1443435 RepID=UPI00063F2D5A|nr:GNAT family N-acetyltransferase [Aneurinibacillus tyrosinisolvens]